MFKTETHTHVLPVSTCSKKTPEEMVRLYHEAGYQTMFISDHFSAPYFIKAGDQLTFEDKVHILYDSYLKARKEGERYGMNILFSVELSLCSNHWLLYGVDLNFLLLRPDIFDMTLDEFHAYAKAHGITIIQAHPLRDGHDVPHPEIADGFEVINTNRHHENYDEKVFAIAKKHHLLMSAGSDAHNNDDVGGAAMLSENEIKTVDDYLTLLKSGKAKFMKWGEIQ